MDGCTADEGRCQAPSHADKEEAEDPAEYGRRGCVGGRGFRGWGHDGRNVENVDIPSSKHSRG